MSSILFVDGPWRICRTGQYASVIQHQCGDEYNLDQQWWHISQDDYCVYCRDKVPAPIQGLLILHNWDRP